jgi:hypothetical protein
LYFYKGSISITEAKLLGYFDIEKYLKYFFDAKKQEQEIIKKSNG